MGFAVAVEEQAGEDTRLALKARLLRAVDDADAGGAYDDQVYAAIIEAIDALTRHNPTPAPITTLAAVQGNWEALFAQFGPRHTAGKAVRHETKLSYQSFSKFAPVPIRVTRIRQEIDGPTGEYTNVMEIEPAGDSPGGPGGQVIVHGRFAGDGVNPLRFLVDFYATELRPGAGAAMGDFLAGLGLDPATATTAAVHTSKLWSDIVYVDEDIRINRGSVGGVYINRRIPDPLIAVAGPPPIVSPALA